MYLAALRRRQLAQQTPSPAPPPSVLTYFNADDAARIDAFAIELADTTSAAFRVGKLIGQRAHPGAPSGTAANAVWPMGTEPKGEPFGSRRRSHRSYPPLEPLAGTWRTWNLSDGIISSDPALASFTAACSSSRK